MRVKRRERGCQVKSGKSRCAVCCSLIAVFFLQYSLAYACLKLVNYSFFFWLPFYLSNNFGWKEAEADKLSIWYDVGGIVGTHVRISFCIGRNLASFEVLLLAPQPSLTTHPTSKHADLCENKKSIERRGSPRRL